MIRLSSIIVGSLLLVGCVTTGSTPPQYAPVCEALVGPIYYNSKNIKSRRHAGPDLAPELAKRNKVGRNLRCPQYER